MRANNLVLLQYQVDSTVYKISKSLSTTLGIICAKFCLQHNTKIFSDTLLEWCTINLLKGDRNTLIERSPTLIKQLTLSSLF